MEESSLFQKNANSRVILGFAGTRGRVGVIDCVPLWGLSPLGAASPCVVTAWEGHSFLSGRSPSFVPDFPGLL